MVFVLLSIGEQTAKKGYLCDAFVCPCHCCACHMDFLSLNIYFIFAQLSY